MEHPLRSLRSRTTIAPASSLVMLPRVLVDNSVEANAFQPSVIPGETLKIEVLSELLSGNTLQVNEFLKKFLKSLETSSADIQRNCLAEEWSEVGRLAHGLKGCAFTVGACALGKVCAELEKLGVAGDGAGIRRLIPGFNTRVIELQEAIRRAGAI